MKTMMMRLIYLVSESGGEVSVRLPANFTYHRSHWAPVVGQFLFLSPLMHAHWKARSRLR